jgi:hypothetical protein
LFPSNQNRTELETNPATFPPYLEPSLCLGCNPGSRDLWSFSLEERKNVYEVIRKRD